MCRQCWPAIAGQHWPRWQNPCAGAARAQPAALLMLGFAHHARYRASQYLLRWLTVSSARVQIRNQSNICNLGITGKAFGRLGNAPVCVCNVCGIILIPTLKLYSYDHFCAPFPRLKRDQQAHKAMLPRHRHYYDLVACVPHPSRRLDTHGRRLFCAHCAG